MSKRIVTCVLATVALLAGADLGVAASSSGGDSRYEDEADGLYEKGMKQVREGKYDDALRTFQKAHEKRKKDAEILNMLAYTHRKTGNLEQAFEYYSQALAIQPKFPQAREYLGEAHIQAALLQIEILAGYGEDGSKEHEELVRVLRKAAETLQAEHLHRAVGGDPEAGDW